MLVAIDLDRTWSISAQLFNAFAASQLVLGNRVVCLTGNEHAASLMTTLKVPNGVELVIVPKGTDKFAHAEEKAQWLRDNGGGDSILIDDEQANCVFALGVPGCRVLRYLQGDLSPVKGIVPTHVPTVESVGVDMGELDKLLEGGRSEQGAFHYLRRTCGISHADAVRIIEQRQSIGSELDDDLAEIHARLTPTPERYRT